MTHDRMFLRHLATRILEIDRGRIFDWSCDYDTFLRRKEDLLAAEEKQNALFDKKLAEEEVWIRQGIKARCTANEGRVRRSRRSPHAPPAARGRGARADGDSRKHAERHARGRVEERRVRLWRPPNPARLLDHDFARRQGRHFRPQWRRQDHAVRCCWGSSSRDRASVRLGTNLQVAYFDQLRQQLNVDASVQENVGQGRDTVQVGGQQRHVIGYLREFLFSPERARTEVRYLSGGERVRVLLAKLFARPANVIVMDEPTNDLDAETLELLEERLVDFAGTVLVVSHDREFLNNIVSSSIVFDGGNVREFIGGYDDWLRQRSTRSEPPESRESKDEAPPRPVLTTPQAAAPAAPAKRRLSFKQQQELLELPATIERLESQIAELHDEMAQPDFYRQSGAESPSGRTTSKRSKLNWLPLICGGKSWSHRAVKRGSRGGKLDGAASIAEDRRRVRFSRLNHLPRSAPMIRRLLAASLIATFLSPLCAQAQQKAKEPPARPDPTAADFVYGTDSERQKFDFWQAKSDRPTPLVLLIHGGGWVGGDKNTYGTAAIQPYLDAGISVVSLNYRFIAQAMQQQVEPPVKACVLDAARALQTIRAKAQEWNLDPKRVGATGGSAGACTSLWLALHDDLADPKSRRPDRAAVVASHLRRRCGRPDVARSQGAARVDSQRRLRGARLWLCRPGAHPTAGI